MKERARDQGGPGTLTDDLAIPEVDQAALADEPLAELAARYRLRPSAARPGIFAYAGQLWARRHFIVGFATARNVAMYTEARLGQLWQVLTPLLNAAVYYLIFGLILNTSRGVPNFLAFLITGIFIFNFTQRAFITTSRVMPDSLPLIRALPFPRGCLPIGYVLIELEQLVMSMLVLSVIVLASGEPLTWYWLLAIPVLPFAGRIQRRHGPVPGPPGRRRGRLQPADAVRRPDLDVRLRGHVQHPDDQLAAASSDSHLPASDQPRRGLYQPDTERDPAVAATWPGLAASRTTPRIAPSTTPGRRPYLEYSAYCHGTVTMNGLWLWGIGWAIVALVVGFVFFWEAETRYGRG